MEEIERLYAAAAGPDRYPPWLYMGGIGLKGGMVRLKAVFFPCTVPRPPNP